MGIVAPMLDNVMKLGVVSLLLGFVGWVVAIAVLNGPGPVLETLIGGLLVVVLYSLIALGVVLIFKASCIFNYAQGSMVLFAALSVARLSESMPLWGAVLLSAAIMVSLAYAVEFLVLRRLVHQEQIILFMATIGITYFLDGFGQMLWGSDIYQLDYGLTKEPIVLLLDVIDGGLLTMSSAVISAGRV